jgi:pyridoxal 5-phosphate dependent beta-lyase
MGEHLAAGPERIRARLAAIGAATRTLLDGVAGWRVVEPVGEPTAITTLVPPVGVEPAVVRARLIEEHRIVTTVAEVARSPFEITAPVLRVSPHVDVTAEDLDRLVVALGSGIRV